MAIRDLLALYYNSRSRRTLSTISTISNRMAAPATATATTTTEANGTDHPHDEHLADALDDLIGKIEEFVPPTNGDNAATATPASAATPSVPVSETKTATTPVAVASSTDDPSISLSNVTTPWGTLEIATCGPESAPQGKFIFAMHGYVSSLTLTWCSMSVT
jgi:hypothetical protein